MHCTYLGKTQKQHVISLHQSYYRVKRWFFYTKRKSVMASWEYWLKTCPSPINFTTSLTFTTQVFSFLSASWQSMLLSWQQHGWSWILLGRRLSNPYFSRIVDCGVLFHCLLVLTLCEPAIIKWHSSTYSSLKYPQIMTVKNMYNTNIWQLLGNK